MKQLDKISLFIILLGLFSIILENVSKLTPAGIFTSHLIDLLVSTLFIATFTFELFRAKRKIKYIKKNIVEFLFIVCFLVVIVCAKSYYFFIQPFYGHNISTKFILVVCLFNAFKVLLRMRKLSKYLRNLTTHPAQTIVVSFALVILVGTIFLMMSFSSVNGEEIGFVNSLFTATSATCVTGLVVLDTAKDFSPIGKSIIMILMQIGGLGIMILASFAAFLVGKKMSLEEKLTMSYMLNEDDTRNLARGIKNIVLLTLLLEGIGALMMMLVFKPSEFGFMRSVFYSAFHAVSAFCNAGFALFSDNLVQYRSSGIINFTVAGLIIAGGISFVVIMDSYGYFRSRLLKLFKKATRIEKFKLNTKIVILFTSILIIVGTLLIYRFEHKGNLLSLDLKTQYLEAFFQSVTLRTAGFNTMDIGSLHKATYVVMILFMFIGGASGSIAGGIKVNTLGVLWASLRAVFNGKEEVVIFDQSLSKGLVNQAYIITFLSLGVVFAGTLVLSLCEQQKFLDIIFETVSAFGTVGLSTGITPHLSIPGKLTLVLTMFIGRVGMITLVTAFARTRKHFDIRYPEGRVLIG